MRCVASTLAVVLVGWCAPADRAMAEESAARPSEAGQPALGAVGASGGPPTVVFEVAAPKESGGAVRESSDESLHVVLERAGAEPGTRDALAVVAGTPVKVPRGTWVWRIEAPGRIGFGRGTVEITGASRVRLEPEWRRACSVHVADSQPRLDAVTVLTPRPGTFYTWTPREGLPLQVPEGRFATVTLGPRGPIGTTSAAWCREDQALELSPRLPESGEQVRLVHYAFPDDWGGDLERFVTASETRDGNAARSVTPLLLAWGEGEALGLFSMTDGEPHVLFAQHPKLTTLRQSLDPSPGVVQLDRATLRRRSDLTLTVDFRPRTDGRRSELVLLRCGDRFEDGGPYLDSYEKHRCAAAAAPQAIQRGVRAYRLADLDTGQYVLEARIGEEVVYGLGAWLTPALTAESPRTVDLGSFPLVEHEVFGHILRKGQPSVGEVRFFDGVSSWGTERVFPTDEDLTYHLRYFGERAFYEVWLEPLRRLDPGLASDRYGLLFARGLSICLYNGGCQPLSDSTRLVGDGPLDLEVESGAQLEVTVVDAETREPLAGAPVGIGDRPRTLLFIDGKTRWEGVEPPYGVTPHVTDAEGRALLLPQHSGEMTLVAFRAPDYELKREPITVPAEGTLAITVELRRDQAEDRAAQLRFRDGSPLAGGALVALMPGDAPEFHCVLTLDGESRVLGARRCRGLERMRTILIAPGARLTSIEGSRLARGEIVEVERAGRARRVRFVDADGNPVPGFLPAFEIDDLLLTPDWMFAADTLSGYLPAYPSDAGGWLVLEGLDPLQGPEEVARARSGDRWWSMKVVATEADDSPALEVP